MNTHRADPEIVGSKIMRVSLRRTEGRLSGSVAPSKWTPHSSETGLARWSALFGLAALMLLASCSSKKPGEDMTKLLRLVNFQRQFTEEHEGREPLSADELREWVKAKDPQELAERQIGDVDTLFISSRDGEPFVIVPRDKGAVTSDRNRIVAYEQTGVDGLRLVAFDLGQVMEMKSELVTHLQEEHVPK